MYYSQRVRPTPEERTFPACMEYSSDEGEAEPHPFSRIVTATRFFSGGHLKRVPVRNVEQITKVFWAARFVCRNLWLGGLGREHFRNLVYPGLGLRGFQSTLLDTVYHDTTHKWGAKGGQKKDTM
ncbi:hypothetical protein RRG08_066474 [Elysia crispata]|uniref:Uncharacterized protein n=1 Tax=Elysia crispata TaxID=231223 RepID=A0AAE1DWL8_9GAST|nr:hypothetical protein RRG08_066474 [Elysia crispata]